MLEVELLVREDCMGSISTLEPTDLDALHAPFRFFLTTRPSVPAGMGMGPTSSSLSSSSSRNLTVQLGATLKAVISDDFPEKWPELVSISKQLLSSSNIHEVVAGSIIVLEMVRAFR